MRDPAGAAANREQGGGRVVTQAERGGHGGGADVVVGRRRTGQVHGAHERFHDGEGAAPLTDGAGLLEQDLESRIAGGVERVTEAGDGVATTKPVAHYGGRVLRLSYLFEHGGDPLGRAAVSGA